MTKPTRFPNRDFVLLSQAQFISQIGNQLFSVATLFWLKHATGSAALLGLLGTAGTLPALLLGPISGILVDRLSRRAMIILSDLMQGLALLPVALLTLFAPQRVDLIIPCLFVMMVISSIVNSMFEPAIAATLPDLVPEEKLAAANSASMTLTRTAALLGPGLGGIAFGLVGAPLLFLIDAASFFYAATTESFVRFRRHERPQGDEETRLLTAIKRDALEGLRYVWRQRGMRNLLVSAGALNFLITPILILMPFYVEGTLGAKANWYGFLLTSFAVGSLASYTVVASSSFGPERRSKILVASLFGISIGCGLLGLATHRVTALLIMFLLGAVAGFFNVSVRTLLQIATPSEMRGRVFGVVGTLTRALSPLAMALAGVAADMTGQNIPLIYLFCGGALVVTSLIVSLNRDFRSFLRYERKVEEPRQAGVVDAYIQPSSATE